MLCAIKKFMCIVLSASVLMLFFACSSNAPNGNDGAVDIGNTPSAVSLATAEELVRFFSEGTGSLAKLASSIDIGDEMLVLKADRGNVAVDGAGFTISGAGDCVLRLDPGASVTLSNITIIGEADALGLLGDNQIGGKGITIQGGRNGLDCTGQLSVAEGASLKALGTLGSGICAEGLTVCAGGTVDASGGINGINVTRGGLTICENADVKSVSAGYNALKCEALLTLEDGATLTVENQNEYHGAEIGSLSVEGAVTVNAKGGKKGTGLFVAEQYEDVYLLGSCSPAPRHESGDGAIKFVDKLPAAR